MPALWDLFCRVIDNYGDVGVCWRLSADLAGRGERVRLWVDDPSALAWMAPAGHPRVEVRPWRRDAPAIAPGDVVVEAFGCQLDDAFIAAMAGCSRPPVWLNLEYLSAQEYAARSHGLPSPVGGLVKYFFYPGFTAGTGGLLREPDLMERQRQFDRAAWLSAQGIAWRGERLISLFCYEPQALPDLMAQVIAGSKPSLLLVTAGRSGDAVRQLLPSPPAQVQFLPLLEQRDFDHLLWSCDLNFVRGEDSLVRAIWAGRPLIWQLYPQDDLAHHDKLEAFLRVQQPHPTQAQWQRGWNGLGSGALPALDAPAWQAGATALRERLLAQTDLTAQLCEFVAGIG